MKCIRNSKTQEIRRVKDNIAEILVKDPLWKYCLKSEWKTLRSSSWSNPEHIQSQIEKELAYKSKKDLYRIEKKKQREGKKDV